MFICSCSSNVLRRECLEPCYQVYSQECMLPCYTQTAKCLCHVSIKRSSLFGLVRKKNTCLCKDAAGNYTPKAPHSKKGTTNSGNARTIAACTLTPSPYSSGQNGIKLCRREKVNPCLLYTSPSPRDQRGSRMPSSA